jgi:hypothetical protein
VSLFLLVFDRDKHTVDVTLLGDRETGLETLFNAGQRFATIPTGRSFS